MPPRAGVRAALSVGIITGFYVPLGTPPAAETDGPVGAAMLAGALTRLAFPAASSPTNRAARRVRRRCVAPISRSMSCRSAAPSMT